MLYDFLNFLLNGTAEAIQMLIGWLPDSPFSQMKNEKPTEINLGYVTWLIPFPTMILHFSLFLIAVGSYYGYRVLGRWLKMVRS